jgi:hypothetical protein
MISLRQAHLTTMLIAATPKFAIQPSELADSTDAAVERFKLGGRGDRARCRHTQFLLLCPASYPQPRLMHEWQNRLSEEREVRREIEERDLDPVAAGLF